MKYLFFLVVIFSSLGCMDKNEVAPIPFEFTMGMPKPFVGYETIQDAASEVPAPVMLMGIYSDQDVPKVGFRFRLHSTQGVDVSKCYSYPGKLVGWKIKLQDSTNQVYEITKIWAL